MQQDRDKGVNVPQELHAIQPRVLEEYVRARLLQFAQALAGRISPSLSPQLVQTAAFDTLQSLPPPDYGPIPLENRDLQLVFRHDCLSLGCLDAQCVLCEHNPHRRCSVNFAGKYLVNDVLKAKCDAPIRVEVIDRASGQPVTEDLGEVQLEMCILDGNQYDQRVVEAGEERSEDLDACALLLNNKAAPLLVAGAGGTHNSQSKVVVPLSKGAAVLPDLHVSDSSEALLSGRKPPFRLLVRAVGPSGGRVPVRHCVSEGFVVATRRTRTAGKVEIPNVDDHVSKLEHMGKETVKKLQDLRGSAQQVGIELSVPDNTINKVGEFRKLALQAEADGHLRQKLQQVLKLSKEKWDEARDHALKAVVADNRMRIWYADKQNMEVGLLFTCRLGNVDLERPVGLLTNKSQEGGQTTMEATLMAQQTPTQRDQVRQLQPQAVGAWWASGHPGWAIYPVDSEQFMSTGALDSVSLPSLDSGPVPIPASPVAPHSPSGVVPVPPAPSPGPLGPGSIPPPPGFNPALASAFGLGSMPPQDMLLALSPYLPAGAAANPFLAQQLAAAQQAQQQQQGQQPLAAPPAGPGSMAAPPPLATAGGAAAGSSQAAPPASAGAVGAMGPPSVPAGMRPPAGVAPQQPNGGGLSVPVPLAPAVTSPFAAPTVPLAAPSGGVGGLLRHSQHLPSIDTAFSLGHLTSLFGADLARFPHLASQLAGLPTIPQGGISADLEQLLQHHAAAAAAAGLGPTSEDGSGQLPGLGGSIGPGPFSGSNPLSGPGRAPSFPVITKIESLELPGGPDPMGPTLMHDITRETLQRAVGGPGAAAAQAVQEAQARQGRGNSMGLETMQSIEDALDHLNDRDDQPQGSGGPGPGLGGSGGSGSSGGGGLRAGGLPTGKEGGPPGISLTAGPATANPFAGAEERRRTKLAGSKRK